MHNELEHHSDGSFQAIGSLPGQGGSPPREIAQILGDFVKAMHAVRSLYGKLIADDGKLIGQERFELTNSLDTALNHLILLRARFEGENDFSAINIKYDYRLNVRITGQKWSGHGLLGRYQKVNFKSFEMWLSRVLKERLTELIQFYASAQADGIIDSRERIVLNRAVDRLIFGIILVRLNIQTGDLG